MRLRELPKFIVLEPGRGIRLDLQLEAPACEFEVRLDTERPGRSFILLLGHKGGPMVQRARISGHAKVLFDPEAPGDYVVILSNPTPEPVVIHLDAREVPERRPRRRRTRSPPPRRPTHGSRIRR